MHFPAKCNSGRIAIQLFNIKYYLDKSSRIPLGCKNGSRLIAIFNIIRSLYMLFDFNHQIYYFICMNRIQRLHVKSMPCGLLILKNIDIMYIDILVHIGINLNNAKP